MISTGSFKTIRRDRRGVTLIELTIAIAIFSVVIVIAFDAFLGVLKFNRETVQKQSIQDHAEFLFSLMTKEIRLAKINYHQANEDCAPYFNALTPAGAVAPNSTYLALDLNTPADGKNEELRFQNFQGLCVRYFFAPGDTTRPDSLKVARHNPRDPNNPASKPIDGIAPGDTKTAWVLPMDISVNGLDFTVRNKFDLRLGPPANPAAALMPPLVRFYISMVSSIWNPSQVQLFEEIAGRNIEQF